MSAAVLAKGAETKGTQVTAVELSSSRDGRTVCCVRVVVKLAEVSGYFTKGSGLEFSRGSGAVAPVPLHGVPHQVRGRLGRFARSGASGRCWDCFRSGDGWGAGKLLRRCCRPLGGCEAPANP